MEGYTFTGDKYMTRGINEKLPSALVMYLLQLIEYWRNKGVPLDYLQVFTLESTTVDNQEILRITHTQEVPPYKEIHTINQYTKVRGKIFVIDDMDHVTMLWSHEY